MAAEEDVVWVTSPSSEFVNDSIFLSFNASEDLLGNETNTTGGYVPYNKRPETYVVPIVFALIFFIGVVGNGTLMVIFARNRQLCNVPNTYIISLALGDLMVILFTVPFISTIYTVDSWPYGEFECKLSEFVRDISVGVTVFTLTALSADRYFAIVNPMRKHAGAIGARGALRVVVAIWILAIILALPTVVLSKVKIFNVTETKAIGICYPFPNYIPEWYKKVYFLIRAQVYYAMPLIIIASFYILMARHLLRSMSNVPGEMQVNNKQIQSRKKVAKMVLCFVVIFAVCFLPNHVFLLWFYFNPNSYVEFNAFWHILRILGFCLGFINSCINPIALYCISGTFRKYYNKYLFCCLCKAKHTRGPARSNTFGSYSASLRYTSTVRRSEAYTLTSLMNERPSAPPLTHSFRNCGSASSRANYPHHILNHHHHYRGVGIGPRIIEDEDDHHHHRAQHALHGLEGHGYPHRQPPEYEIVEL
ncbi:neuropeptide CCHamide-1 receptor-like [Oratosquilla oratoria]|uniref:neuropeptide CCHamide-1 receptor-like n=1 Tax=Oratosquilla oratoria TaxID=337810 RepID=UPI003F76308A